MVVSAVSSRWVESWVFWVCWELRYSPPVPNAWKIACFSVYRLFSKRHHFFDIVKEDMTQQCGKIDDILGITLSAIIQKPI